MNSKIYTIKETAQEFPADCGWVYVPVPQKEFPDAKKTRWGLIPIQAKVGNTSWRTSLLPMGGGSYFIPLKATVRKQENICIGDDIELHFSLL